MSVLEATGLTKRYGDTLALDQLNLRIEPGEIFCLLGQNGAGKTTTINLLLGFLTPSAGTVRVAGVDVATAPDEARRHLAYIPEVVMLYGHLSGVENLDFFSRLAGFRYPTAELAAFLTQAGLQPEAQHQRVSGYSKGMRQKVGIAVALAKDAAVLLMDEPTSGLDPKATAEFTALVQALGRQGKAVLMATHDIFNAVQVGTRVGIMRAGRLEHVRPTAGIEAAQLQQLYLDSI